MRTKDGQPVTDRHNSHGGHPVAEEHLSEAIGSIDTHGRGFLIETHDFGRVVGNSLVVETGPGDEVYHARRPGRAGSSRFVRSRDPEPTTLVTVILMAARHEAGYVLITAWYGPQAEPEPWDRNATPESAAFWATHAFVEVKA